MLLKEWNSIGVNVTEKLVDSVPNRLYECVRAHGYRCFSHCSWERDVKLTDLTRFASAKSNDMKH